MADAGQLMDGEVVVAYAWRGAPRERVGATIITPDGEQVTGLVVIYGATAAR